MDAIGNYTLRQIKAFLAADARLQAETRAARLVDINQAFSGGKGADKHLKALLEAAEQL